jgi:hypothetical protein
VKVEAIRGIFALLKALLWPSLVLLAGWCLYSPALKLIAELTAKIHEATSVQMGGLSLAVQQRAQAEGRFELAEKMGSLSREAVRMLLQAGELITTVRTSGQETTTTRHVRSICGTSSEGVKLPTAGEFEALRELERKGLVRFEPQSSAAFEAFLRTAPFSPPWPASDADGYSAPRDLMAKCEREKYQLTKTGEEAVTVIIDVIAEELGTGGRTKMQRGKPRRSD